MTDENGRVSNDPQQVMRLSDNEAKDTRLRMAAANATVKAGWKKRLDGVAARAAINPKLVK